MTCNRQRKAPWCASELRAVGSQGAETSGAPRPGGGNGFVATSCGATSSGVARELRRECGAGSSSIRPELAAAETGDHVVGRLPCGAALRVLGDRARRIHGTLAHDRCRKASGNVSRPSGSGMMTRRLRMVGTAHRWLTVIGGVLLGCSAPSRSRAPSLAETAPALERASQSGKAPRSESARESEAVPRQSATVEPALHENGCGVDAGTPEWLGSHSAPAPGWWKAFSRQHPSRTMPVSRGGWAPIADVQIFGMDASSSVFLVQRSWTMGEYKLCYREALYKDLADHGSGSAPPLQGDWVARFTQRSDRICAVEVLETSLPGELSNCLRSSALRQEHAGSEAGQFEIALVFRVPYTLPPPSRNQRPAH